MNIPWKAIVSSQFGQANVCPYKVDLGSLCVSVGRSASNSVRKLISDAFGDPHVG